MKLLCSTIKMIDIQPGNKLDREIQKRTIEVLASVADRVPEPKNIGDINLDRLLSFYYSAARSDNRGEGYYHPSDLSLDEFCPWRASRPRLGVSGVVEKNPAQTIFDMGHVIHELIQRYLREIFDDNFKAEQLIEIPDLKIRGHTDGILDLGSDKIVLEIKSTSTFPPQPPSYHKRQVAVYMAATKVPRAIILYAEKPKEVFKPVRVRQFDLTFDKQDLAMVVRRAIFMEIYIKEGKADELPRITGSVCFTCNYRSICPEYGASNGCNETEKRGSKLSGFSVRRSRVRSRA